MATKRQKVIELGLELMKKGDFDKQAFLESYTALTQKEAAAILGCRPCDLNKFLKADYRINDRPKYLIKSVLAKQNELIRRSKRIGA